MKHTYTILLAILLVVAMAVPAFAFEYVGDDDRIMNVAEFNDKFDETHKYATLHFSDYYETECLVVSSKPLQLVEGTNLYFFTSGEESMKTYIYDWASSSWVYQKTSHGDGVSYVGSIYWTNYDLYDSENRLIISGQPYPGSDECDGTACPATDVNYDNICDDCGKPLTMTLRNTLYDYAKYLAESKAVDGYPYWAIFQWNDSYTVHISKSPMSSGDGVNLSGDGMMYNRVSQSADGVNGGTGWYSGFYETYDSFVEANHSITNFRPALPMAETILGVAGEQLTEKTLPELGQTMKTILLCGVGCLALLILLHLLGKKSQIFHL